MPFDFDNFPTVPPVILAPMAGITDLPFRNLVLRFGADLVVSEMIASQEMVQNKASTQARAELGLSNEKTSVQIAGRDTYWMAEAAKMLAGQGARVIDINMGCPARKVTSGWSGSALMRDPNLALALVECVVEAVDVPVTLKMRLGWDDNHNADHIAAQAEGAGVRMITIHGRTRQQFYKGSADWRAIARVKRAVSVPVIVNGDIIDSASARQALAQSGADGVMVGRGARGAPWKLAQIGAKLAGKQIRKTPQGSEYNDIIIEHYEAMLSFYGPYLGVRVARKHLGWYLDPLENGAAIRAQIIREDDPAQVVKVLQSSQNAPKVAA